MPEWFNRSELTGASLRDGCILPKVLVETEAILKAAHSKRVPPLSALWKSLKEIETGENEEVSTSEVPVYVIRAGLLTQVETRPIVLSDSMIRQMAMVANRQPQDEAVKIRDAMETIMEKYELLGDRADFEKKQERAEGRLSRDTLRRIGDKYVEDLKKEIDKSLSSLPAQIQKQIRYEELVSTYQTHGLNASFLGDVANDAMDFPLSPAEVRELRFTAEQARVLLENEVYEIISKTLLKACPDIDDNQTGWAKRRIRGGLPPIELMVQWLK